MREGAIGVGLVLFIGSARHGSRGRREFFRWEKRAEILGYTCSKKNIEFCWRLFSNLFDFLLNISIRVNFCFKINFR